MLIERRAYTFRPGTLDAFWKAQMVRGVDPETRPIMARLISYFETASGPSDQIVHLWRYDSYEDWFSRLFFKNPKSEPYYRVVRPLMLEQENRFMLPAPVAGLSPLWSKEQDWLTGGIATADLEIHPGLIVEEETTVLQPGSIPAYWEACTSYARDTGVETPRQMIGCFYKLVGQQHQVTQYRWHHDLLEREAIVRAERDSRSHRNFLEAINLLTVKRKVTLLRPAPIPRLAPLFRHGVQAASKAGDS